MINLAFESSWNFFFTWERVWPLSLFKYGYIEFSLSPFAFGFPSFLLATGAEVLMDIKTQCLFVKHHVFFLIMDACCFRSWWKVQFLVFNQTYNFDINSLLPSNAGWTLLIFWWLGSIVWILFFTDTMYRKHCDNK